MLIKLFACAEAGSEDFLVGTEKFWSGDMSSAEGRSADESASESILVVSELFSSVDAGTEMGPEILTGTETGSENLSSAGSFWGAPEMVASEGRFFGLDNL